MCLFIEVHVPNLTQEHADALVTACQGDRLLSVWPQTYSSITNSDTSLHLGIAETDHDCCCSLHSGRKETPTAWFFPRPVRGKLRRTLQRLYHHTPDGFFFMAIWAGDSPIEVCEVTWKQMVYLIWNGQIGKRTKYWVLPQDRSGSI